MTVWLPPRRLTLPFAIKIALLAFAVLVALKHLRPDLIGMTMSMTRERLYLFDTTLRDGAQTPGVDFSLEDKRADRRPCSTSSASTMSRAAIPAPTRPTPPSSRRKRDESGASSPPSA